MKFKQLLAVLLVITGIAAMLAGCGSNAEAPREMAQDAMAEEMANGLQSGSGEAVPLPENRKWIVTVNMNAETEDLDAMLAGLLEQVSALGGYVENQDVYNGSSYEEYRYRSAGLTLRIPADRVEEFTKTVTESANVVSQSRQVEDVTLQYVDTESSLAALRTEEARLLELLENAETMSDLLEIEARLGDVRYELESAESQKRTFDNQIDYATVYLQIEEVREYTPVEEPTLWQRISGGFMDSLRGLGTGLLNLFVWFIVSLPYLVVLGGAAWLIVWLILRSRKKKAVKKEKQG